MRESGSKLPHSKGDIRKHLVTAFIMPATSSGTFTFLFTDIEGSTALWEKHPEAMRGALARHDFIMSAAVEGHGGHVFKTVGDAFYAAFDDAPSALHAACRAQRHLADAAHPEIGTLRVRMALHSGAVETRDGDYFGPPLNRVTRLLAAGHGGQVLLSHASESLTRAARLCRAHFYFT